MNCLLWGQALLFATLVNAQDGAALFARHCAACHREASDVRAPLPDVLALMPRPQILVALESGSMKTQAEALSHDQRLAVAAMLSKLTTVDATPDGRCATGATPAKLEGQWNGWGVDLANTRFQPSPGLRAEDVPKLKLKWVFGFPNATVVYSQPTIVGGRLYFGSTSGTVYSVDSRSGCVYWTFKAAAAVRTAVSLDDRLAYFGDLKANVYAVESATGKLVWQTQVENHPAAARITGAPVLYDGRLYVPVSSVEQPLAGNPSQYSLLHFSRQRGLPGCRHGQADLEVLRHSRPARQDARDLGRSPATGTSAGAAIWSAPNHRSAAQGAVCRHW